MNSEQFDGEKEVIRQEAKSAWDRDISIRAEFCGDFDSFLAYRVAKSKGLVKVQGEGRK